MYQCATVRRARHEGTRRRRIGQQHDNVHPALREVGGGVGGEARNGMASRIVARRKREEKTEIKDGKNYEYAREELQLIQPIKLKRVAAYDRYVPLG